MEKPQGVLVMAYGTPKNPEDVAAYYTHIRGGRPPEERLLRQLQERYRAIGGRSPLYEITRAQAKGIEDALQEGGAGRYKVYLGMKHTAPFLEDAVDEMHRDGIERAVALVLAPHFSKMSVGSYFDRIKSHHGERTPELRYVDHWHDDERFLDFAAERVERELAKFPEDVRDDVRVVFSAHSLPARILREGDPYADQLHESGDEVARRVGLRHWMFGWQSAGRTEDEWLGPDIREVIKDLRRDGHGHILLCPIGFTSDHLEVLYDIDVEAQALARDLDLELRRTESPNADPAFTSALAAVARRRLEEP